MPKGPQGEKRPADLIGAAVMVAKIATGEVDDVKMLSPNRKRSGKSGGKARASILSKKERREIAEKAASVRWNKDD